MTTEQINNEPSAVKHYMIIADEIQKALLSNFIPGLRFMEVEGVAIPNMDSHVILANPLPKSQTVQHLAECQN
jgi:hypothetical protein